MGNNRSTGKFVFEPTPAGPVGSILYNQHLKYTPKSRFADFAGYLMPLWFTSISDEHDAVRNKAGLFDCTHMGVLEVQGPDAAGFINTVTTNNVTKITPGRAQYSYILDAAGNVLDDIIVYQRAEQKYMVVVNAANEPKIKAYLDALLSGKAPLNTGSPDKKLAFCPIIRDMRDTSTGDNCRLDIAIQGPASLDILCDLFEDEPSQQLKELKNFRLFEADLAGVNCIISRTGYTGAGIGYELFVHPENVEQLWEKLIEAGKPHGLALCGLGARDSLRIEAGLPLYGHELDGPFGISPFEAGYGWAVKLDKGFFIGKEPMQKCSADSKMQVARVALPGERGIRPVRANDVVVADGKCIGWILSSAKISEKQIAIAYITKENSEPDIAIGVYYLARNARQISEGKKESARLNESLQADINGNVLSRFEKF